MITCFFRVTPTVFDICANIFVVYKSPEVLTCVEIFLCVMESGSQNVCYDVENLSEHIKNYQMLKHCISFIFCSKICMLVTRKKWQMRHWFKPPVLLDGGQIWLYIYSNKHDTVLVTHPPYECEPKAGISTWTLILVCLHLSWSETASFWQFNEWITIVVRW